MVIAPGYERQPQGCSKDTLEGFVYRHVGLQQSSADTMLMIRRVAQE